MLTEALSAAPRYSRAFSAAEFIETNRVFRKTGLSLGNPRCL